MRFSQRIGVRPIRSVIQKTSMDSDLRTSLWNVFRDFVPKTSESGWYRGTETVKAFFDAIWRDHFKIAVEEVPNSYYAAMHTLRKWWLNEEDTSWDAVYDLIDFCASTISNRATYTTAINSILAREMSAYRMVGGQLQPIIDEAEIASIEHAVDRGGNAVKSHLETAIRLLADRSAPDYRNSIKESISAVEAAVRTYTGGDDTLGAAIAKMQKTQPMHPAFASALSKLYGYTSDEGGIRHSLTEEVTAPTQAEAQFMLVACSAFINLLQGSNAR